MYVELTYSSQINSNIIIESTLYTDNLVETGYSKLLSNRNNNDFIVEVRAFPYHNNIIVKIDTNPAESNEVDEFYKFDVRDHFFKEYQINNIEELADSYLETPMIYLTNHRILYEILDENMIPLVQYPFGAYYNPVATCSNAFGCYQKYEETQDEQYLDWFFLNVKWIRNYRDENSFLKYEFAFNHETQILDIGWTSAMAQGQALALMSMAYHKTQDMHYLELADDFFLTMCKNFGGNWNVMIDSEDYLWFEEYPNSDFCHVLNGKLFAMWGLWDYYCVTRNEDALHLLQGGIASVIDNYPLWDVDGVDGSHYCCHTTKISNYHEVHKEQLIAYRDMFDIQEFDVILKTFTNQQ